MSMISFPFGSELKFYYVFLSMEEQNYRTSTGNRLIYLDALRGFAILLVVVLWESIWFISFSYRLK